MEMSLVLQLVIKYLTNWNFELMVALDEKQEDHQIFYRIFHRKGGNFDQLGPLQEKSLKWISESLK